MLDQVFVEPLLHPRHTHLDRADPGHQRRPGRVIGVRGLTEHIVE